MSIEYKVLSTKTKTKKGESTYHTLFPLLNTYPL